MPLLSALEFAVEDELAMSAAGRCLLPNGAEHNCSFRNISASHTAVSIETDTMSLNDIVICSFPAVGIVPGIIINICSSGFVMKNVVSSDRLSEFSDAVQKHGALVREAAERRSAPRIVPAKRSVRIWYCEGQSAVGVIENLSTTGAAIAMNPKDIPFHGSIVRIGSTPACVVRRAVQQIGARFLTPIPARKFGRHIVL